MGAIGLESDVAGVVDVVIRGELYGARDALGKCLWICLAVNMEEDGLGICSQRRVVVGMGVESSGWWRLRQGSE